jgi:hypothetical protein
MSPHSRALLRLALIFVTPFVLPFALLALIGL